MPSSTCSERALRACSVTVGSVAVMLLSSCVPIPASPLTAGPAPANSAAAPPAAATATPTSMASATPVASATSAATVPPTAAADSLAASFAGFAASQSGQLSVAVAAVGDTEQPIVLGELGSPVAWSTAKVPIAVAVERTDRASALRPTMRRAITASDNEAAETLWQSLGTPEQAAAATDAVLRDYGDTTTRTQSQQVRPPYTAFGQTRWALADQARFTSQLPCRAEAAPVYAAMGQVVSDQRWGLGVIPAARFKGGWGPSSSGYLVRQLGVIDTGNGQVATTIAVEAASLDQGTATLTRTARWLQSQAGELPTGRCS